MSTAPDSAQKFDTSRAGEYRQQSRIALAGYEACHELSACMLAAALGTGREARILVAGAGGGATEIVTAAAWSRTGASSRSIRPSRCWRWPSPGWRRPA